MGRDFDPGSFVNYFGFRDEDELIEHIIRVDNDESLYREYLMQPCYHDNKVNEFVRPRTS